MIFNKRYQPPGSHAILSASKYHWINYDEAKLVRYFDSQMAAARGSQLHELAHKLITLGVKLPQNTKTLSMYVNDAIGYKMVPEQLLYYSENCFGTPDAIAYSERRKILRISDLKTGESKASENQLKVYAAIFLLEYGSALGIDPYSIVIELRIYQNDEIHFVEADPDDIAHIMEVIVNFDSRISELKEARL